MEYAIVKKDAFRIVGVRDPMVTDYEESFKRVPVFWQEVSKGGAIPRLCRLMDGEPAGVLGVSTCYGEGNENYYYIAVATGKPVPEGMHECTVPAATWAVFKGHGAMPSAIQELQKRIFSEWLPTSGYEWAKAPDIEVYPEPAAPEVDFEVWLPIVKK